MANYTFETSVTDNYGFEHEVKVNFDYSPPEEEKFDPVVGIGNPYFPPEVDLLSVVAVLFNAKFVDFIDMPEKLSQSEWALLESRAFDHVEEVETEDER